MWFGGEEMQSDVSHAQLFDNAAQNFPYLGNPGQNGLNSLFKKAGLSYSEGIGFDLIDIDSYLTVGPHRQ